MGSGEQIRKSQNSIRHIVFNKMLFMVGVSAAALMAAMLLLVTVIFTYDLKTDMRDEAKRAAAYMNTLDTMEEKCGFMRAMYDSADGERETFILADGTVLYDSYADSAEMENHLTRPEVREALLSGLGESVRSSQTVGKSVFYCAVRLDDGSVLRLSKPSSMLYTTVLGFIPIAALMFLCVMFFTRKASGNVTRNIMMPIYRADLNNPDPDTMYEEFRPFFERIAAENEEKAKTETIRREFTANVSHELKTPLTSISGYAQMIHNGMARRDDVASFGMKIEKESERLLLLIDDIIRLSHLDETSVIDVTPINLNEVVAETLSRLEQQTAKRGITVYYSGDDSYIDGKESMIDELVFNIIDNAVKYNRIGGRIDIYVGKCPGGTEFSVSDTGIGIPEQELDRIFERFYRVDKSHSKTVGGTGLGLSIVKHIAMIHKAEITVKSHIGEGTIMTVIFKPSSLCKS